ncbi:hypothetical protein ACFFIY_02125 [Bhargavaea ullalensis]|uniref:hypothetical protein n=1 Tax=Bhargavaea ullalensis TaxID=1265685 RepID=UPI003399406A
MSNWSTCFSTSRLIVKDNELPRELQEIKEKTGSYPDLDDIDYDYMIDKLKKLKNGSEGGSPEA